MQVENLKDKIEMMNVDDLIPYFNNPKEHPTAQIDLIASSIKNFGFIQPIVVDKDNEIIIGHGRLQALKKLKIKKVPVVVKDDLTEEQIKALRIADNKVAESEWDMEALVGEFEVLGDEFFTGFGTEEIDELLGEINEKDTWDGEVVALNDRFVVPPFSYLDTRQGYWQDRKNHWKTVIQDVGQARKNAKALQQTLKTGDKVMEFDGDGVSLLDPVLAEIMTNWFSFKGAKSFDVFAGDTIFGFVNSWLENEFTGIELRQEQAEFNQQRVDAFDLPAKYINDDGRNCLSYFAENSQDFLFSCPPYFDLEVYSDLPDDASNQKNYAEFLELIDTAFSNAIKCLKNDRFAVIVVGDVRNKEDGGYYRFPDHIKEIFERNGMKLYNEIILLNQIGTGHLRAKGYMLNRKVVKLHQNVLVFYKGDTDNIADNYKALEVGDNYDFEEPEPA